MSPCLPIVGTYRGSIRLFIYLTSVIYNVGKKSFDRIIELEALINLQKVSQDTMHDYMHIYILTSEYQ